MEGPLLGSVELVRGWRTINCGWCGANGEIMGDENHLRLQLLADRARREAVRELGELGGGDFDAAMAPAEVLAVILGYGICRDQRERDLIGQNRFVITRRYASSTLRSVLAFRGFLDGVPDLLTMPLPAFTAECQRGRVPGVDLTADTLPRGLSAALGMALALRADRMDHDVYALLDGGSLEETLDTLRMAAQMRADRLMVFLEDRTPLGNRHDLSAVGCRFRDCGWQVQELNGHSVKEIRAAIYDSRMMTGRPHAMILHTVAGKGCTFAEGLADCRDKKTTESLTRSALLALDGKIREEMAELEAILNGEKNSQ